MQDSYKYTKLATPTTIRLIQLQPDKVEGDIAISIHTYDTQQSDHDISYRALSYRWGDPKGTRYVRLRDIDTPKWYRHPVHENLWQFIHCAWQQQLFKDQFWTDYFCLHQSSSDEMKEQIPRMGAIYSGAIETVVWLGLSESQENNLQSFRTWSPVDRGNKSREDAEKNHIQNTVRDLWKHEYWSRLWIVQEVGLAKKCTVLMRSCSIEVEELKDLIITLLPPYWKSPYPDLRNLGNISKQKISMWLMLRDYISRPYQCSKLNDRLYGLLGLWDSPTEFIRIDHDRPYNYVMLDAILESAANWSQTWLSGVLDRFADGNTPLGLTKNSNELEEYAADDKTLPHHKELARLAQQAFDIMCFAMSFARDGSLERLDGYRMHQSLSSWPVVSLQQEAVFLGITLAFGSRNDWATKLFDDWKSNRQPRLETQSWQSPWRCAAHMPSMEECGKQLCNTLSMEEHMAEYEQECIRLFDNRPTTAAYWQEYQRIFEHKENRKASVHETLHAHAQWVGKRQSPILKEGDKLFTKTSVTERSWRPEVLLPACANSSEECDGSRMVFEMPLALFRMVIFDGGKMKLEFLRNKKQY